MRLGFVGGGVGAVLFFATGALAQTALPEADQYPMPVLTMGAAAPPAPPRPEVVIPRSGNLVLAGSLGLGSPYGHIGAWLGHQVNRRVAVEMGGGYSAAFGPAVGAMVRAGVYPTGSSFASLGLGVSANFASFSYTRNCRYGSSGSRMCSSPTSPRTIEGDATAQWLNLEVAHDLAWESGLGMRYALGLGFLLNPSAFPSTVGCDPSDSGAQPCGAGLANGNGDVFYTFYASVSFYYTLVRGL